MYNDWMNRVVRMKRECDGASFGTSWVRSGRHIRISEDTSRFIMLHTTVYSELKLRIK